MAVSGRWANGRRAVLLLAVMLGTMIGTAGAATADAALAGSDPADGATVTTWPASVSLQFNERITDLGLTAQVTGPDGQPYLAGSPTADGATVVVPLTSDGPPGAYTVAYRVVSSDGHPVQGQLTFELTATAAGPDGTAVSGTAAESVAPPAPTSAAAATTSTSITATATSAGAGVTSSSGAAALAADQTVSPQGSRWVWPVVVLAAALVLVVGAIVLWARRRSGRDRSTPASSS